MKKRKRKPIRGSARPYRVAKGRPRKANISLKWDHGTGTAAAMAGKEVVQIEGDNPNGVTRAQARNYVKELVNRCTISMRQGQAGEAITKAFLMIEGLKSASPLTEYVQAQIDPEAAVMKNIDAVTYHRRVFSAIHPSEIKLVEHVCRDGLPLGKSGYDRPSFVLRAVLDRVADKMGY